MRELPASTKPLVEGVTPFKLEQVEWISDEALQRMVIESAFPHLTKEEVEVVLHEYGY
jgi:hypothetical protein